MTTPELTPAQRSMIASRLLSDADSIRRGAEVDPGTGRIISIPEELERSLQAEHWDEIIHISLPLKLLDLTSPLILSTYQINFPKIDFDGNIFDRNRWNRALRLRIDYQDDDLYYKSKYRGGE